MILVYGTASSGKSNIAEQMSVDFSKKRGTSLVYLATMENETKASKERIRKHRAMREGKGFYTIEEPDRLKTHVLSVSGKTVLLECVSNYCANVYFKVFGERVASDAEIDNLSEDIVSQILMIASSAMETIVVTNDIFGDGTVYDEWTESYMRLLATVNARLGAECDRFYEVVNGIPVEIK